VFGLADTDEMIGAVRSGLQGSTVTSNAATVPGASGLDAASAPHAATTMPSPSTAAVMTPDLLNTMNLPCHRQRNVRRDVRDLARNMWRKSQSISGRPLRLAGWARIERRSPSDGGDAQRPADI